MVEGTKSDEGDHTYFKLISCRLVSMGAECLASITVTLWCREFRGVSVWQIYRRRLAELSCAYRRMSRLVTTELKDGWLVVTSEEGLTYRALTHGCPLGKDFALKQGVTEGL